MLDTEFDILAAKVLANEATPEETARLKEALATNATLRADFSALQSAWAALQEGAPLAKAIDAAPSAPPLKRKEQWRAALARNSETHSDPAIHFDQSGTSAAQDENRTGKIIRISGVSLALAAMLIAAAVLAAIFVWWPSGEAGNTLAYLIPVNGALELRRGGKTVAVESAIPLRRTDEIRVPAQASAALVVPEGARALRGPQRFTAAHLLVNTGAEITPMTNGTVQLMREALFQPSRQLFGLLVTTRGTRTLEVYSPVGFTANLSPAIIWRNSPGKSYDLTITDELTPNLAPFRRTGVVSPVEFASAWPGRALAKDGLYRLQITETGKPLTTSEIVFRTLPQADITPGPVDAAGKILSAYRMLTGSPALFGDALGVLSTLPPKFADSELALRLKIFCFGQLGYQDDFQAAITRLQTAKQ